MLGPAMFLLYINDLPATIKSTVRLLADDCIMYKEITSSEDAAALQVDINSLCVWQNLWLMKFNPKKCFAMHITHKKAPRVTTYKMGDSDLQALEDHTYLGVSINNKLSWNNHINKTVTKANKTLGLLRRNFHHCQQSVKATAYKTLVRPQLEYCSTIWDPYQQVYINAVEAIQNRAARFVKCNYSRHNSVSVMVKDLEWKSLQERRPTARLSLLYKASHHLASIDLSNFYINPEGSRQTRQTSALSFRRPQPNKNCYKYSFLPRTIAQWNSLLSNIRESPTIEILKSRTQNSDLLQMTWGALSDY